MSVSAPMVGHQPNHQPKINPGLRPALKPDGSPIENDRTETGPTDLAFEEWGALGLTAPNLSQMRHARLERLCHELRERDYGGALLFDPLNIRYASDATNMQVWSAHNAARALFVSPDGYMVLWDFARCTHLFKHLPLVREVREGAGFFYFLAGDHEYARGETFAREVDGLLRERSGSNRRLAVDKMEIAGVLALQKLGVAIGSGQQVLEHARLVKSADEINAMRCAMATCEIAVAEMNRTLRPGMSEVELWSVLHTESLKRGGEWIETRILASGPRTNPWMQEAGPRLIQEGDLVGFDTDLVGPYGMCADISRTWYLGDAPPKDEPRYCYQVAHEHVMRNIECLRPGVSFTELTQGGHQLPEEFTPQRYGVKYHGVGLCDEFPAIYYPDDFDPGAFEYVLEPGMVICVEAYMGKVGGAHGVKLEDQVLITESGYENLTRLPFDERLLR